MSIHRGYRISPVTLWDVNEICDPRVVLEPLAYKLGPLAMTTHGLADLERRSARHERRRRFAA